MTICSKKFTDIPFAHRAPFHDGHCRFIHGHNWSFEFVFGSVETDENDFVIDFGKMGFLKNYVDSFDHALVLSERDPDAEDLESFLDSYAQIMLLPSTSCEGIARWLFQQVKPIVSEFFPRVRLLQVEVSEDSKNKAVYSEVGEVVDE